MRFAVSEAAVAEAQSTLARWTSRVALLALGTFVTALFLHRLLGMPTPVAINLVAVSYLLAALALLSGLGATIAIWRTGATGTARVVFGVCLSLALLSGPLILVAMSRDYPQINDVTTDVQSPPEFAVVGRLRPPGSNATAYPGEAFAAAQVRAYPDIKPMLIDRSAEETFELVVEAVKRLKMDIVREDAPGAGAGEAGMIEAVDRTLVLGFYEDVAIRVTGNEARARVDIRSASRFGWTDLGHNAERIRALMHEIVGRVAVTVPTAEAERTQRTKAQERQLLKRGKGDDQKSAAPRKSRARER